MSDLQKRLEKIEKNISVQSITATTEDGQPLRIRRQSILPLTVASFRRRYAAIEGEAMPVSPFDERLDYLKRVGAISTSQPLLEIAVDCLRRNDE
jgi:hypothetical protein